MLTAETKKHIDSARQVLVGKVPDPKQQIDQITNALIYKFMDDMDDKARSAGGKASFFTGDLGQYAWRKLMDPRKGAQERLNLYTEALGKFSTAQQLPQLFRDIFRQAFLPYRDPETLNLFLKEIEFFDYNHSEELGNAFEYLLSIMGAQGDAGQFRTPRHIIDFIVEILDPDINDTILDPACGTAGFLISAYKNIAQKHDGVEEQGKPNNEKRMTHAQHQKLLDNMVGYDISSDMVKLARVNMYLHGNRRPSIYEYDTLTSEERWDDSFDIIMANPPFMSPKGGIRPHSKFSVESSRAEVLFVDYIMTHLKQNGRAGIIVPEGVIFQSGTAYKQLRRLLVEDGLLAVISLPSGVFNPYAGVKTSILVFDNNRAKQSKDIIFAKVENDGFSLGAQRRPTPGKNDLPIIAKALKQYRQGKLKTQKQIDEHLESVAALHDAAVFTRVPEVRLIRRSKILELKDCSLSVSRYAVQETNQNQKWPAVELSEVAEVKRGTTITSRDVAEGDIPVIAGGQKPAYFHNQSNRSAPVITISGSGAYAGFINYFDKPIFVSDASSVQSTDESKALNKYIYWVLKGRQDAVYQLRSGMAQPHVYAKDLAKFIVPLPSIAVQKQIVDELDGYQKIIEGARQVVESYKPTIKIDPTWPVKELGEMTNFVRGPFGGSLKKETFVDSGYAVYEQYNAINDDFGRVRYFINKEKFKEMERFQLHSGDLIVSCSGTMGKIAVAPPEFTPGVINQALLKITPRYEVLSEYLRRVLETPTVQSRYFMDQAGSGVPNVPGVNVLKGIEVPLPPKGVQEKVIEELNTELKLIKASENLIHLFEQKIKDKVAEVWGE